MDVKANSDLLWRLILIILHTPFFVHLTQGLRAGRGSLLHKINTLLSPSCTVFLPFFCGHHQGTVVSTVVKL